MLTVTLNISLGDPPTIFFSTENVVVGEGDGAAEVCLNLSVPLSTELSVEVSSTPGSGNTLLMYECLMC